MKGWRLLVFVMLASVLSLAADEGFLGKWDLTITTPEGQSFPSWLEVLREDGALKARFVARGGSVFPVPDVKIENGELRFQYARGQSGNVTAYKARLAGKQLEGTMATGNGPESRWTGSRPPSWPKTAPRRKPQESIALFNGKDLSGWKAQDSRRPLGWIVKDGAMANEAKANNIYSDRTFDDFKLEVEFTVAQKSNSGIYLRGRYEIQVLDDFGQEPESHRNGALYGFLTPKVNASKPAGEWQTLEATLIANRLTVILNGVKTIDNEEIPGITGGALNSREGEPGPIMLQGDHGPVQYRKVVVTPLR